jgi:hypothetical protein
MTFALMKNNSFYENLKKNEKWLACVAIRESEFAFESLEGGPGGSMPIVRPRHR